MSRDGFLDYVLDQLGDLPVEARAMFGGHGLYAGAVFFGIVHDARLFFKTDERFRADFIERGTGPFRPNERQTLHSYYEVPPDVLEDGETLVRWARRAASVTA